MQSPDAPQRSARLLTLVPILILALLVVSISGVSLVAPAASSALGVPGASSARPVGGISAAALPAGCISGNYTGIQFTLTPVGNATRVPTGWAVGPVPGNVSINFTISGPSSSYNWQFNWGDGSTASSGIAVDNGSAPATVTLAHDYVLPALYVVDMMANYTCGNGGGAGGASSGEWLEAYGPAGPTPITVSSNVTSGPSPLAVNYTATIVGAPANATANWTVYSALWNGGTYSSNQTAVTSTQNSFNAILTLPGTYNGEVVVFYPGGLLEYGVAWLPAVNVTPLALLNVSHSTVVGASPWNVTFWANATNLTGGGAYTGNATVVWNFGSTAGLNGSSNPWFWQTGPTNGSPIWRLFYLNVTGGTFVTGLAFLVAPDGAVLADGSTFVGLQSPGSGGGPGTVILLNSNVTSGPAPLDFNLTATAHPVPGTNLSPTMQLVFSAVLGAHGSVWNDTISNWSGTPTTVAGTLTVPGSYYVVATAFANGPYNWSFIASANLTIVVSPSTTTAPSIAFSASPASGSAPLNVTLSLVAVGGIAPYNLSVCREGPFAYANGSGTCTSIGSTSGWNGSALALQTTLATAGNYTIVATVTARAGASSSALAAVLVTPAGPTAPLAARGSYIAPSAITSGGATYGFVTIVTGGVAPYTIQWNFDDGAMGSALPGSTVLHTYTTSGIYRAILTVTDARGTLVRATVGPLVVVLPIGPTSVVPWWALGSVLAIAAVVGIVSAVVLAATLGRIARRREALNWFREIEERRDSVESVPRSR
ncbi:MAG TPA: PKD domain-containing protein [Thermoplasmata archaeon]|nr:PKD domain-containing protein [Thermoplasmata archaeon]